MAPPTAAAYVVCPNCRSQTPRGARYCQVCGTAIDPGLVAELNTLYSALLDLDARIESGQGDRTLTHLRDEYRARYLSQHGAPAQTPAQVAELQWLYRTLLDLDARIAAGQGERPLTQLRDEYRERYLTQRSGQTSAVAHAPPAPIGPAFSWRAFIQDQAIGIMAYLGGFLLIIATLTFIVGAWQALDDLVKLAIVLAVYALFFILGLALRRASHLRTVSNAYLAVFALMTPLVALAVYRFALQGLNLPVAGILAIAAAYGAVIYLALAWRTQVAVYGYFGWVALLIAVLASANWFEVGGEWWVFILTVYSLALLAPSRLRRFPSAAVLATSALPVCVISSVIAAGGALLLGLAVWVARAQPATVNLDSWIDALLAASVALPVLALAWALALRAPPDPATPAARSAPRVALALADTSVAASVAFTAFSVAVWMGATRTEMAYLFAAIGALALAAVAVARAVQPTRQELRRSLIGLCVALLLTGASMVALDTLPNWPLMVCLGVGIVAGLMMTWMEREPWWLFLGGLFLLAEYPLLIDLLRRTDVIKLLYLVRPEFVLISFFFAALALALWILALAMATRPSARRYALPISVLAALTAVLATVALPFGGMAGDVRITPQADYQTVVLGVFALAALLAGVRERQPVLASIPVGFFGLLLPLPYAIQNAAQGLPLSLMALASALIALGLRRALGRTWAYAPYAVTLWLTAVAAVHARIPGVDTAGWAALGIPFAAGLLLVVALLAGIAAWWERHPVAMVAPVSLAFAALLLTPNAIAQTVLVFVFVAVGIGLRQARGRFANVAWLAAAAPASLIATTGLRDPAIAGPWFQVGALLALAVVAYIVAAQERAPWLTLAAVAYALLALLLMPAPDNLAPTIGFTIGAVLAGLVTRVLVSRAAARNAHAAGVKQTTPIAWTGAWYAVAGAGSIETVLRSNVSSDLLPIALLVLAGLAYLIAAIERTPWLTPLAAVYGLWAALVIPGPDRLLPTVVLAIGAALVGAVVRQFAGRSWALALYSIAVGASLLSLGRVVPFDTNVIQAALLTYTVVACVVVAVERQPLAGIAPAVYGSGAVIIQSDARLLLPIALGFGLVGMILSRRLRLSWALPWYIVAAVASLATAIRGAASPGFEPIALAALALLAYAIVAVEALPELLPISLALGMLALLSGASYFQFERWQTILAFAGLSYAYTALQWLWRALPGLGPKPVAPPSVMPPPAAAALVPRSRDPRAVGVIVHRWVSLLLGGGTLLAALASPDAFTPQTFDTQVVAGALLGMAGLLALQAWLTSARGLLYLGGELLALALTWEARWLGADNVQAYVIAPGSYHLLIGTLLPRDSKLRNPVILGRWVSVIGTLILLAPTFFQTFSEGQELLYMGVLTVEALLIIGIGVGTRARALIGVGAAFVGIAALRAAVLAVIQGVPVFLLIAAIALALLAGATGLSVWARRGSAGARGPDPAEKAPVAATTRSAES